MTLQKQISSLEKQLEIRNKIIDDKDHVIYTLKLKLSDVLVKLKELSEDKMISTSHSVFMANDYLSGKKVFMHVENYRYIQFKQPLEEYIKKNKIKKAKQLLDSWNVKYKLYKEN